MGSKIFRKISRQISLSKNPQKNHQRASAGAQGEGLGPANVPSSRCWYRGNIRMYSRPRILVQGTSECGAPGSGVTAECSKSVPRVSWSVRDTFLTLWGHSQDTLWTLRSPGPEGPRRQPVRHSLAHPPFSGTLARRARETPVVGRGVCNACPKAKAAYSLLHLPAVTHVKSGLTSSKKGAKPLLNCTVCHLLATGLSLRGLLTADCRSPM